MKGWLLAALLILAILLSVGCEVWVRPPSGTVVVTPPPRHDQGSHDDGSHDDDSSDRKRRSR